jgi:hypothetical protein
MSESVTPEQVRQGMADGAIVEVPHHACAFCKFMTRYVLGDDGQLWFDPGCHCNEGGWEPRSWQDAADWINMQPSDAIRIEIASRFGVTLS